MLYFGQVLIGFLYMENCVLDVLVNPVEQTALLDHNCLQLFVDVIQRVNRTHYFHDLLVSLLVHFLFQGLESFFRKPFHLITFVVVH